MVNTNEALSDILAEIEDYISNKYLYGAVGTGTSEPTADDTALEDEVYRKALQGVQKVTGGKVLFTLFLDSSEANGYDIGEMGIFDASTDGLMLCRNVIIPIEKTSDIEFWMEVQETISVTQ